MAPSIEQAGHSKEAKDVAEKSNEDVELATSSSHGEGAITVISAQVDHAGYHRKLGKRQIMM